MMALGLVYPLGAVLQGWLADTHGVRAVTVAGALALLGLAVLAAVARPTVFTNLGDPAVVDVGPLPVGSAGEDAGQPTAPAGAGDGV
jgi:MFS family permease